MITRHKNPIEETFLVWINNFPDSFHPLDIKRFYRFVKTILRYSRKNKWKEFEYFKNRILEIKPKFSEENIEYFYRKMQEFASYDKESHLHPITLKIDDNLSYNQINVINNKIITTSITEEEYVAGGRKISEVKKGM